MKKSSIIFVFILCTLISCHDQAAKSELEDLKAQINLEEQNKTLVRNYALEEDQGSKDFIDKYIDPDFVFHYPNGAEFKGLENLRKSVERFQTAFPDVNHQIEYQISEGDLVATRYTKTAIHKGEYMGVAPTGKQLKFTMNEICRIKEEKITEAWIEYDPKAFNELLKSED